MKALLVTAAAVGLLASTPAFASAGAAAPATASADAEIVTPISVSLYGAGLNFGRIAADSAASTVTIDNANGRTSTSPNVLIAGGSAPHTAVFNVAGQAGLAYTASLATATTTISNGSNNMTVTLNLFPGAGTLDSGGADSFKVGGSLAVGANQAAGAYTGSFGVSVQYN